MDNGTQQALVLFWSVTGMRFLAKADPRMHMVDIPLRLRWFLSPNGVDHVLDLIILEELIAIRIAPLEQHLGEQCHFLCIVLHIFDPCAQAAGGIREKEAPDREGAEERT